MRLEVGTAPVSWGVWFSKDPRQTPWNRFLDEVVDAGYSSVELGPYGYLPTDRNFLDRELRQRNLKVSGTFAMGSLDEPAAWPELERQIIGAGEILAFLNAKFLILIDDTYSDLFTGARIRVDRLNEDSWHNLINTTHRVADLIRDNFGLTLVYHPHAETHVEYEDQIEKFLEQTDPSRVSLCLDTGHHAYRGGDPISFLRRHSKRIAYLHLKNVDKEIQRKVQTQQIPFGPAVAMGMFCEPSLGIVDFAAFRDALSEVNYNGWITVEQDMYPVPFDKPLPIAKRTREYLHEIGIG
jgi:inosose dehydratase